MTSEGGVLQEDNELCTGAYRLLIEDPRERERESLLECWNSQTEHVRRTCNIFMFLTELMCITKRKKLCELCGARLRCYLNMNFVFNSEERKQNNI